MTDQDTKKRSPLKGFIHHQGKSIEESGKALAGLLPQEFRDHAANALDEAKTSWQVLFDGVIDTVDAGLDKLRSTSKRDDPGKEKVQIEIEAE
ncbi:MAG: hypothetical protein JXA10_11765 [Anaerolineae bacterium]|nr:hypothetical protein [Anaerolineae bacterium]